MCCTFLGFASNPWPFGHDLGFACEGAVPAYHVVHVGAVYEIIVDHILHFAPPRHFCLRVESSTGLYARSPQYATPPFGSHSILTGTRFPFSSFTEEFVAVRIPRCAPAAVYHFLVVDIDCLVAGVVHNKIVFSRLQTAPTRLRSLPWPGVVEIARKVHHVAEVAANKVLKVYFGFFAHYCFAVSCYVYVPVRLPALPFLSYSLKMSPSWL